MKTFLTLLLLLTAANLTVPAHATVPTASGAASQATSPVPGTNAPIPWSELGAQATAKYSGDALAITPEPAGGMRLHCEFQRLAGEVTPAGLWLFSTVTNAPATHFCVVAAAVGREGAVGSPLPVTGTVAGDTDAASFLRPGLTEEYSVSVDGVRQDFVVAKPPAGAGELRVELAVYGARAEAAQTGVRLVLDGSGRKLAYSRLSVVDATGRTLTARLEVAAADRLAVVVADAAAVYPVRIDPTFSDANWISLSLGTLPGANGTIYATAVDGSGNLYVGGLFTTVGSVQANNIAEWNGTSWSALGSGMNGQVNALAYGGSALYAGGAFTTAGGGTANGVASWNGAIWSPLGAGMSGSVNALAFNSSSGILYAGGSFTQAGGVTANNIAQWNVGGGGWSSLTSGTSGHVYALLFTGANLYAGGNFGAAGGTLAANIAKWNGASWSPLAQGITGGSATVSALAVSGTTVYAGGNFTRAGVTTVNNVAKWNGSAWSALSQGVNGPVYALAVSGSTVYVGGNFTTASGFPSPDFAEWNGGGWAFINSQVNNTVYALTVSGSTVYAGGAFTSTGEAQADSIASWNGFQWSALSGGDTGVQALAVSGSTIFAGGAFTTAGGTAANNIASWNGTGWSALGSGLNGAVDALALSSDGSTLYAGGSFTTAGGDPANYIASWDIANSAWAAVGSGMNAQVQALAVSGGTLYAGGSFTTADGNGANYIASWDGTGWSALGSGMNEPVLALAATNNILYAGGEFTSPGNCVVEWNGTGWVTLGAAANNYIFALALSGGTLYAGGYVGSAGGVDVNNIASWNGSSWSALGQGVNGTVYALTVSGGILYAGGEFTTAGAASANNVASWNGATWSPIGSGVNSTVLALAANGNSQYGTLYVGGEFSTAGQLTSPFAAAAHITGPTATAQSTVAASPGSVTADGATTSTITVTLLDAFNYPVIGDTVTLAQTSGAGTPTISAASGVSSSAGVVTFTVDSTTAATDTFTATDTTTNVVIAQTASVTFTAGPVTAAQSTVTASPGSVPADGATTSTITVTLLDANSNPVSGDTVTLAQTSGAGSPTISAASGPSDESGVVTFTVSASTPASDVFTATDTTASTTITETASVTFTPTIQPVTIASGISAMNKIYDGTTAATICSNNVVLSGVAPGDVGDVFLSTNGYTATFAGAGAANGVAVTVGGLTLTGPAAGNYTLTQPTALTANITPKALTAQGTLVFTSKVYDATPRALPTGAAGLQAAETAGTGTSSDGIPYSVDSVSLTGTASYAFASKDVATGLPVTETGLSLTGPGSGNYTLTPPTFTASITPKTLNYAGISAASKVYDGTTTASLSGLLHKLFTDLPGGGSVFDGRAYTYDDVDFTTGTLTGTFASAAVGNGIVVTPTGGVGLTPDGQSGDYVIGSPSPALTANITAVTVTITSGISAMNKPYDGTTTATLCSNNVVLSGVLAGDVGNVSLSTNGYVATFATAAVADGIAVTVGGLSLTGSAAGNYTLTQPASLTANITPLTVTVSSGITANDKIYDSTTTATITSNNVVLGGVLAGDADNVFLSTNGYVATFASAAVADGIAVTVSGLGLTGGAAADYTLTQPTGLTADITPGPVTAVQSSASASPGTVVADGTTTSTITVTLTDAYGNPVSGKTMTLAQTSGAGSPAISAASGPSSASGVVTFTVSSLTPATDVFAATDTSDSVVVTQTASVTFAAEPPLARVMLVPYTANMVAEIKLSDIATNWSDLYGYPISLTAINFASTNNQTIFQINLTTSAGAYVVTNNAYLGYFSTANVNDQISYTINDNHGNTVTGLIEIVVSTSPYFGMPTGQVTPDGNSVIVSFAGQPGYTYQVQRATTLSPANWTNVGSPILDVNGPFSYTDNFSDLGGIPPSSAYYRLEWQP